jgi:hypothetical protein
MTKPMMMDRSAKSIHATQYSQPRVYWSESILYFAEGYGALMWKWNKETK